MEELREPLLLTSSDVFNEEICVASNLHRPNRCKIQALKRENDRSNEKIIPTDASVMKNALYMRALSIASNRDNRTSILLKVPFLFKALVVGLWPGTKGVPTAVIVTLGVLINIYIVIGDIFVCQVCKMLPNTTANMLSPLLCYGTTKINHSKKVWAQIFRPAMLEQLTFTFSQLCGYVLMVFCVLRALPRGHHTVSLNKAITILTKKQWKHLNLQILVFFLAWVVFYSSNQYIQAKYFPNDKRIIFIEIKNLLFWLYIGTPCWIFAVMTNALESLVEACFYEIKDARSTDINDVIIVYNQLRKHVFSTTRALKVWFVVHWFSFGATFAIDTAIGMNFFQKDTPQIFWAFGISSYFYSFYTFLYPCVCAACLTSKCGELLERLDVLEPKDWHEHHPLRHRRNMNEFLMFANQVQCGFKVGRLKFDNVLAWLSLFAEVLGLTVKLL